MDKTYWKVPRCEHCGDRLTHDTHYHDPMDGCEYCYECHLLVEHERRAEMDTRIYIDNMLNLGLWT